MHTKHRYTCYDRVTSIAKVATVRKVPGVQHTAAAWKSRVSLKVFAVQSGWNPQPQQQQQQPYPQQQPYQQQQAAPSRQPAPLARTSAYQPAPVFLELTQVLNKQVVTRTSGRSLGCISGAWLDPARGTLVSFDLDDRKPGSGSGLGLSSPARAGNIPLSALRQIGDVVLVHDESGLYEQDLDGRLGFVNPVGLDVRTRTGEFLGKVRDLSFSPDTGVISRVTYDEFGLPFLPISFFDCYSVSIQDVLSIGRSDIIVYDDAKYRERKESNGLFAAIPSLLKSLNGSRSSSPQLALPAPGGTSDMYRLGAGSTAGGGASGGSRYLPADYTYEQWQADLRRWEAETGMTYEQYLRAQGQQQPQQPMARNALPPARSATQPSYQQTPPAAAAAAASYPPAQAAGNPYIQTPRQGFAPQQQQQQQPSYATQPLQQQFGYQQQPIQQPMTQQPQAQQQQQQRYDARQQQPQQQQFAAAAGQPGVLAWNTNPAAAAANPYAGGVKYPAPGSQQGAGSSFPPTTPAAAAAATQRPSQQQQQPPQFRSREQQFTAAGSQTSTAAAPQSGLNARQQQQQQQRASQSGVMNQPQQPPPQQQQPSPRQPQQQQQQQPSSVPSGGRPVDDWLVRDSRPRINEALAEGMLPLTGEEGAAAAAAAAGEGSNGVEGGKQQQVQPQQQPEVV